MRTALFALVLTACGALPQPMVANPPANAVQPCQPLGDVSGTVNMGQLLNYTVDVVNQYQGCSARHQALIDFAKR